MTPRQAEQLHPQERIFLQEAWKTIEDGGYTIDELRKVKVGVYVGVMSHRAHWSIANRVSYTFNFKGPSLAVDTGCSSSFVALHLACQSLFLGEIEMALVGGVNVLSADHYLNVLYCRQVFG